MVYILVFFIEKSRSDATVVEIVQKISPNEFNLDSRITTTKYT